jgi:putative copper export protein
MWRTGLALLALWALALARRPALALLFALGALAVSGATGHSAAIAPVWAVPAKAIHLLAASAWLGGLLWLLVHLRGDPDDAEREAARVSTTALVAVLLVALTGVVQTALFLPSLRDLVHSAYGALVLAKAAGLLVLVAFGAYHRYRVLPRLARDARTAGRFTRTLRGEVALMLVVVLLGGLLAYVPPPAHAAPLARRSAP